MIGHSGFILTLGMIMTLYAGEKGCDQWEIHNKVLIKVKYKVPGHYSLDQECSPKTHVLKAQFSAWCYQEVVRPRGLWDAGLCLSPSFTSWPWSGGFALPWDVTHNVLSPQGQSNWASGSWTATLKLSQNKPFLFISLSKQVFLLWWQEGWLIRSSNPQDLKTWLFKKRI
jgi:hypothetical protein